MAKNKYPNWFRHYSPPMPPITPAEKTYQYKEILSIYLTEYGSWENFDISAIKDADSIQLIVNDYEHEIQEIQFAKNKLLIIRIIKS